MKLNIILIFLFFRPQKQKKTLFLGLILRFSNLNVLHKGLLMQDWVFRLGWSTSKTTTNIKQLLFMSWLINKDPNQCEICLNNFSSKRALNNHIQYVHEGKISIKSKKECPDKPFKCDTCESTFSRKTNLETNRLN